MKTFPSTVVIADDDEDDITLLENSIKSVNEDISVSKVYNGLKLSMYLNKTIPDVIFLDINMPVKNGIECLKEVKSNKSFTNTRVVIYSTSNNPAEVDECYNLGANFYFIKPNDLASLKQNLIKIFSDNNFLENTIPAREKFVLDYRN